MTKPALGQLVGKVIKKNKMSKIFRKAFGRFDARTLAGLSLQARNTIETQSRADFENWEPCKQMAVMHREAALRPRMTQHNTEAAGSASAKSGKLTKLVLLLRREHQARLHAEAKLRQLQIGFAVLAKRTEQAALDGSAAEYAQLLTLEAAASHAVACRTARVEAERKLKAEQDAAELMGFQAEADRNAWQLQERANVLLRKAGLKAQERLATETMASKAAEFKLQTERELAVIAEQLAYAELQAAREVELKLRYESRELAMSKERLASLQRARQLSEQLFETKVSTIC